MSIDLAVRDPAWASSTRIGLEPNDHVQGTRSASSGRPADPLPHRMRRRTPHGPILDISLPHHDAPPSSSSAPRHSPAQRPVDQPLLRATAGVGEPIGLFGREGLADESVGHLLTRLTTRSVRSRTAIPNSVRSLPIGVSGDGW